MGALATARAAFNSTAQPRPSRALEVLEWLGQLEEAHEFGPTNLVNVTALINP